MQTERSHSKRIRITAAVCAVAAVAGGTAGVFAVRSDTHAQTAPE